MPIVKYIPVHTTPLSNIEYILNGDKNSDMKFATGLNCTANPQSAYDEFRRTFELCAKERFFKSEINLEKNKELRKKEKIRLHHYVQSFVPGETTPEEAHKIGLEWAKRVFGDNHQVIVSTHLDKGHIHNHIAVCPYNLDGKQWYANSATLKKVRHISDVIAKEHGLSVIENPKHKNTMKYNEWLAKQNGTSWKQILTKEIDKLILSEDVHELSDLADKLKEQGYTVRCGKYLSIKAEKQKYAIRSFRLGDGYSVEELKYRIEHKEQEISMAAIERYSGVQREYAICMRQMQISVFYNKPKRVTYHDLCKSAELLNYLTNNNITSVSEFENRLNAADDKYQSAVNKQKQLAEQISTVEKIIEDGRLYLNLSDKEYLTAEDKAQYKKVAYIEQRSINDMSDITERELSLRKLQNDLLNAKADVEKYHSERTELTGMYNTYKRDISDTSPDPNDEQEQLRKIQKISEKEQEHER